MAFEDKTLTCVQCGNEFVFSAGEQQFFEERGLNSPPKRCKPCRQGNKKKRRRGSGSGRGGGEYRSPAFEGSAPAHQRIRNRGRGSGDGRGSPPDRNRDYRSPAFGDMKKSDPQGDYRSPGFREYDGINPDEEYRSPGFKEYEGIKPDEEYRSPGFAEYQDRWADQKPEFAIVCAVCGKEAMVPFLPEEKETPMCQDCYKEHRAKLRAQAEEEAQAREGADPDERSEATFTDPAPEGDEGDDTSD